MLHDVRVVALETLGEGDVYARQVKLEVLRGGEWCEVRFIAKKQEDVKRFQLGKRFIVEIREV